MNLEKKMSLTFEEDPKIESYEDMMFWSKHNIFAWIDSRVQIEINKLYEWKRIKNKESGNYEFIRQLK